MKTGSSHLFSVMFQSTPNLYLSSLNFDTYFFLVSLPLRAYESDQISVCLMWVVHGCQNVCSLGHGFIFGHKWNTLNMQSLISKKMQSFPLRISVSIFTGA
jgi:hypothetical protein